MQAHLLSIDTALLTERTVTRRLREQDGQALYDLIRRNEAYLSEDFPKLLQGTTTVELTEIYVRKKLAAWLLHEEFIFGIWENKTAQLIGLVYVFKIDWSTPSAELAFFLDYEFSRQGIMTEVLEIVIKFCFHEVKMEKLYLRTRMDNYASQRVARKHGFRREGDLRAGFRTPMGELVDIMLFGLAKGAPS